jgi:hypothetical protein
MVHWVFASGVLVLGLILIAQAIAGPAVWAKRPWRVYLWPGIAFGLGILMWPVMTFYTNSAIHMLAHGAWAQALMLAGAAELGLARGKLRSAWWRLAMPFGLVVSGLAFLIHEQAGWLFSRAAFLHHVLGWTMLLGAAFPLLVALRPRSVVGRSGYALLFVLIATLLFCDRDVAPIFGHLSALAGNPHR